MPDCKVFWNRKDAALDAIYFCPHHPDAGCRCRKPNVGMVERAVSELQLDLRRSYVIGDHARDIQLAHRVGAKAILLTTALVDAQALDMLKVEQAMPDAVAKSMAEAVDWILEDVKVRPPITAREFPDANDFGNLGFLSR